MDRQTAESLISALPVPVLMISANERVHIANPAAEALFGPGLEGRNPSAFLRHPVFMGALEGALGYGRPAVVRLMLPGKGSGETSLSVNLMPVPDLDGRRGVLVTFEDLTALDTAEAMRRDFVANVSHELRTPLTALMGFIETLKGAARDDTVARDRFLGIMEREAGRMIRLINDLLSLSRVEAEERRRPDEPVEIIGLLKSVVAALRPRADSAGVALVLDGMPGPVTIPGDPDQLAQVFHNLVENAVKYAAAGREVTLRVSRVEREPVLRGAAVQVDVIDKGEGIDPLHLPRLTERFYRVDTHRSREQGGTGLGLAIVKHIVSRHRGRFRIDSEIGKGSRFRVLLPEG